VLVQGRPEPPPELEREASIHAVGPGWFETMHIPLRRGRFLIGAFAVLACFLAAVGLYGVVAYNTSQRSRELGLRMALGAERAGILRMVVLQGMAPAIAGLLLGLIGAFFGARIPDAILFGVEPRDLSIYAGTTAVLLSVALVASFVPARRASRLDPVAVLRLS
jgi:putative ABC transport system permease protein